jgi:predicted TIM-barrel fold metal-dependent hydrolase
MDKAGVERVTHFARYPAAPDGGLVSEDNAAASLAPSVQRELARKSIDDIAAIQAADPSRIYGLIWAEPRWTCMIEEVERGIDDKALRGVKMIPDHWEPCDPLLFPLYRKMEELGRPIMFHSGILYGFADSSRFCRPALYEALLHFPRLRFSLAHIAWPWVDECIAVFGRFRAASKGDMSRCQMWIDTCRGTPDAWREEALRKAVPFCGVDRLMFGMDGTPEMMPGRDHIRKDHDILRNLLGLSQAQIETFFWGACEKFFQG